MTDLTRLTIAEAREKLGAKEITAVELTDAYLGAIEAANPTINAYVAVTPEKARDMAKASDTRIAAGKAEIKNRRSGAREELAIDDVLTRFSAG